MDNISQFAQTLLNQSGFEGMPQDIYQEKQAEMELTLQNIIGETIMVNLSEQARLDYLDLLKEDLVPDAEKLESFLQDNLPNYAALTQEALQKFGIEYLEAMKQ